MAKSLTFFAFSCILLLQSRALFALERSSVLLAEPCEAPAPDSFRVTAIIEGSVHFAWSPAWFGATHTLKLMQADSNGAWGTIHLYPNVPDSTFTIAGLEAGFYRASISTNCSWGQPSQIEMEERFKIIELVVGGRVPINPVVVEGCTPIQMDNHAWVGFRVRDTETGVFNIFEFTYEDGTKPTIKRVGNDVIVAANDADHFPAGEFLVKTQSPVKMNDRRYEGEEAEIGYVQVVGNPVDGVVEICIATVAPAPWKPQYQLSTLTSAMPTAPPGGGGVSAQGIKGDKVTDSWQVQNPFGGTLALFPSPANDGFEASVTLLSIQGSLLWNHHFPVTSSEFVFPTNHLPSGHYILHIKTAEAIQTYKIQKI